MLRGRVAIPPATYADNDEVDFDRVTGRLRGEVEVDRTDALWRVSLKCPSFPELGISFAWDPRTKEIAEEWDEVTERFIVKGALCVNGQSQLRATSDAHHIRIDDACNREAWAEFDIEPERKRNQIKK